LKDIEAKPGMTKTETYEEGQKALFTKGTGKYEVAGSGR